MEIKLPQYLHKPARILGFDGNNAFLVSFLAAGSYFLTVYFASPYPFFLIAMSYPMVSFLKNAPRGYIGSLCYHLNLSKPIGYQLATQKSYHE